MRKFKALTFFSLINVSSASADPGLGSLTGLLPINIIAFIVLLGIFVIIPVWLVFRARKLHAVGKLTKKKLIVHIAPAVCLGTIAIIDSFVFPIYNSMYFSVFGGYSMFAYYPCLIVYVLFIYLVWSTFKQCIDVMAKHNKTMKLIRSQRSLTGQANLPLLVALTAE